MCVLWAEEGGAVAEKTVDQKTRRAPAARAHLPLSALTHTHKPRLLPRLRPPRHQRRRHLPSF